MRPPARKPVIGVLFSGAATAIAVLVGIGRPYLPWGPSRRYLPWGLILFACGHFLGVSIYLAISSLFD